MTEESAGWLSRVGGLLAAQDARRPEEEPRWHPDPPDRELVDGRWVELPGPSGCEWPLRCCPNMATPCSSCPYHQQKC